ncbi:phosphate ABC transporter substrate-binding protein, PhoT family [Haloarcula vallismortis]|uniref:Phosphate ABC transporter periplasmic substrate-binding protein n=2 Tax=Haloarcula vallismortis TaxID=28442 RepID=M0IX10_HALVA|nr:PstS family phosphate ABC transporter substrate-binding protein [Haloarcula vallismortis]EMA01397.1 phosphate ABC transporter periplasmic substrate-binding protein [Haloarcula vallismortis ATCC 29715]SDX02578.1 phosphate ABC transporter substrate-binding protein, PhoT family [Haloarcula vallismortis]
MTDSPSSGLSRRRFLTSSGTIGALALAGCTQNTSRDGDGGSADSGSDGLSGQVIIKGSSTVFPISDAMAEAFMDEHGSVNVTVDSTGSGGGFENWFCPGDSDINGASRPITDAEVEQCSSNDVEPVEFEIAGDALTVAVNNDADWVDCLTFEELRQIWSDEAGVTNWSDVRDEWPDMEIERYGPASTSGTFDYFNGNVVGEDTEHTTEYQPTEEDETIVQGIRDNEGGMGYFGFAYYNSNSEAVKAVEVKAENDDECTPPSLANAKDGSYPLARPLFLYVAESALQTEAVSEFIRFYLEQAETDVVQDIGYVPSSAEQRDENLEKLDEIAG